MAIIVWCPNLLQPEHDADWCIALAKVRLYAFEGSIPRGILQNQHRDFGKNGFLSCYLAYAYAVHRVVNTKPCYSECAANMQCGVYPVSTTVGNP